MNKKEYIRIYARDIGIDRLDDDFSPSNLETQIEEGIINTDILLGFDLQPESLAKIIDAIGGAEYYSFNHINLLKMLRYLHPFRQGGHAHEEGLTLLELDSIGEKIFGDDWKHIPRTQLYHGDHLALDKALGHLIHAEHFIFLKDTLINPPSGDDTYFDYYPGSLYYFQAITEWFLNSNNRLQ